MLSRKTGSCAFSLMELLVAITIIAILAALIIPVTSGIRDRANETTSLSNLRQIGNAISMYVLEHEGHFPLLTEDYASSYWSLALTPYVKTTKADSDILLRGEESQISQVFLDPRVNDGYHHMLGDYGGNSMVFSVSWPSRGESAESMTISMLNDPAKLAMVVAAEAQSNGQTIGSWYINASYYIATGNGIGTGHPSDRGRGNIHTLFGDGHVNAIPVEVFVEDRVKLLRP